MKILWLTWKDGENPLAGGAEVVNDQLAKRLVADGHEVHFVVSGFRGASATTEKDGYTITRVGNRYTVYWQAYRYYMKTLHDWPDLVIDEVNTMPFFAAFYVKQPVYLFVHQLCREIWFYQLLFPFSLIGYILEPVYLWLLKRSKVITVSESTKRDLMRYGFHSDRIEIISEGIELSPVAALEKIKKFDRPTMLSLGAMRPMKRTLDQLRAFEIAKQSIPDLQLKIAGSSTGTYGKKVLSAISTSPFTDDIEYLGRVSLADKIKLMQKSHAIAVTSLKEGWGLIVTEAASQGAPAVVYDVDGLRDSVRHGKTGLVCRQNTPAELARNIVSLFRKSDRYAKIQENAWKWSREITFEHSYRQFVEILK